MKYILTIFVLLTSWVNSFAETGFLDSALTLLGQTREAFKVDGEALKNRDFGRFKLPVFEQWFNQPLRIPAYERYMRNSLLEANGRLHSVWTVSAATIGVLTRRDLIPPTPLQRYGELANRPGALQEAILALDQEARMGDPAVVPDSVQSAAAMLIFALHDAVLWREMALRNIPAERRPALFEFLCEPVEWPERDSLLKPQEGFPGENRKFYEQIDLIEKIDVALLAASFDDLTSVLDSIKSMLTTCANPGKFSFRAQTRYGEIIISGAGNDHYACSVHPLLMIDLQGDDDYCKGGATGGANEPFGIIVDVSGDDRYETNGREPSFAVGVLGFGAIVDFVGNDIYRSANFYAQGSGIGGCGMLWDGAGDDLYSALGGSQGYGYFGIGILMDLSGNDRYLSYHTSQGCGMTRGMGLLLDLDGNDIYDANDQDLQFVSAQSTKHNGSMSQGAGFGLRRDYIDGHSLAGGFGMLLDAAGDDAYSGGVFSQGVGYWYAVGVLDDLSGNDRYQSVWYGQSSSAHMAVSYLSDSDGNDVYTSLMTMAASAAHDFSVSLFLESGGNDIYNVTANSLGRALNSSVALFVDISGNDTYHGRDGIGQSQNASARGLRSEMPTSAAFLDLCGDDQYPEANQANNSYWRQSSPSALPVLRGLGWDIERPEFKWD